MSRTRKKRVGWGWEHWSVPTFFKRMNRREERSKQNQAVRNNNDVPIFRTRDKYEYW